MFFLCCFVFCVENRVCVDLNFLVSCCTNFYLSIMSLFDEKKNLFFFLLLFLTYQTPKPNWTEPKPNAIGRFSVPSLQVGFGAQYVKTKILGSVQKLSNCLQHWVTNRTEPITPLDFTLYTGALYEILYSQVVICVYY